MHARGSDVAAKTAGSIALRGRFSFEEFQNSIRQPVGQLNRGKH
jgi:hypothetical protein